MTYGYIHSFESFGAVDGPGIRFIVFLKAVFSNAFTAIIRIHGEENKA